MYGNEFSNTEGRGEAIIYDIIIIGGGPGGYNAALRGAEAGLAVMLFERDRIGGVCLNEGCIPTKTLLYSAKLADGAANGAKYGVMAENIRIDQSKVIDRKNRVVRTLTAGIKASLKAKGVETVTASAKLSAINGGVFSVAAGGELYLSKNVILAPGSSAAIPPVDGMSQAIESGYALTSREILDLREIPQRLAVVGGGVIGLEMASYYKSAGAEVSVIEALPHIGGSLDTEIAGALLAAYEKKGIEFHLNSRLTSVSEGSVTYEHEGQQSVILADKLLVSVGRRANTSGIGLDEISARFTRAGIEADDCCRTNIPGLYAIGDVNGKSMLAHTAYREGEAAVNDILGKSDHVDYGLIPSVIYTNPEVASVGLTEAEARVKYPDCTIHRMPMRFSGRFLAENDGVNGICKLITSSDGTILGVHMAGNYSSEIIVTAGMMIQAKMKADDIKRIVFPHPTVAEVLREVVFEG